jgi:hypothetical protein
MHKPTEQNLANLRATFEHLKTVSIDTKLVLETDPATGTSSFVIITRKKPDISWTQYDRVVHYILEHICSDFPIAEDYTK